VDSVLRHTLEAAADLADARYAAIGVIAPDGTSLARFETLGIDAETACEIGDLPTGHGVLGLPISEPRRLRLPDIGAHARSYGFPLAHPPMRSFMGVPLAVRGEAWGCIYVTEASHGTFDETDEEALVALAELASAAIGTATVYHSERTRADALERSISGLAATTEIARAIGGETRLDRVLELVVKRARALVEARAMLIMLIDGDDLVVSAIAGDATTDLLGTRYPVRDSAVSALLATGQAERIGDATTRLRLAISDALQPQTGLIVPLVFHGHVVGALEAFDRTHAGPAFSDEDERLLEAFAASAAIALGSARDVAAETLRRSIDASERERARWARELHDETLQELGAISMTLASAHESDDVRTLQEAVSLALGYDEYAMRGLREIITDLRPGALRALGVKAALELLVARTRKRSGIDVALDVDLDCESGSTSARHAPALEAGLYRIAQEAIANAVKHAHASAISIRVAEVENGVRLTVEDDGRGFDYMGPHASGFGLIGMHERAELIHGTLTIESRPGKGTVVQVFAPSERRPPSAAPWSERRETAEEEGRTG
jgi:two-component system, NarL family, sensor histidine kinase DevS